MKKIMVPADIARAEIQIRKSRFISLVYPIDSDQNVKSKLKELRQEHPDSNHIVWSYVMGDSGTLHGLSDDGEPHGTAGRPVLEVLKGSGLTYVALFVIRYFGGIKLGTGGLVSAYTESAKEVLSLVRKTEKVDYSIFTLKCSYSLYEGIREILLKHKSLDLEEDFTDSVDLCGKIPERAIQDCTGEIREFSNGRVLMDVDKE